MTPVEFLRARLDEDEQVARDAAESAATTANPPLPPTRMWAHIARHAPARVLAEVEAKRRLIEDITADRHRVVEDCWYTCPAATEERDGGVSCRDDDELGDPCLCGRDARVGRRLRLLALPYADHPDYDESWRP